MKRNRSGTTSKMKMLDFDDARDERPELFSTIVSKGCEPRKSIKLEHPKCISLMDVVGAKLLDRKSVAFGTGSYATYSSRSRFASTLIFRPSA